MSRANETSRVPSIRDVARLAEVSHQTVSRVLNDHPSIRPETRARVESAIAQLGYQPNQAARALATQRMKLIGILSARIGEFGPTSSIAAIESVAREAGYGVSTLHLTDTTPESIAAALRQLQAERVDGIVVLAPQVRVFDVVAATATRLPIVTLQSASGAETQRIAADQVLGSRQATEHLITLGHIDILHLAGPQDWIEAESRMQGYLDAMIEADLPVRPPIRGDWTADFGYFAASQLAPRLDFTAVVVANDVMAIGLMHGFRDMGLEIPRDISIVGFDDIPVAAHVWPTLTTVHQDFAGLGRRAVALLLQQITDVSQPVQTPPAPRLIARDSSGPVRTTNR